MKSRLILFLFFLPALILLAQSTQKTVNVNGTVNAVIGGVVILDIYQTAHYPGQSYGSAGAYASGGGYNQQEYDHSVAVTNYPDVKNATISKYIFTKAVRVGVFQTDQGPIELYDCGRPYDPPPLTAAQIHANQQAAQIHAIASKKNSEQAQINAVHWLQSQATNGDASAQCDLGKHYLSGIGCETNRSQGIFWLTQAANQGDLEASNKLVNLH